MMKKVLHITNWYPNEWNDIEALFVKEQFGLFSQVSEAKLLHVEVRQDRHLFKYQKVRYSENETGYYILTRIKTFRIIEILSTFLLLWALFQNKAKKYDLLHLHIAYPLLTYYHIWKSFIKVPLIISEHWSAYHFNFFMPKETTKLNRIKNIFHQDIPLITVSKALLKDIQEFSGCHSFKSYVIPNVIDIDTYHYIQDPNNKKPTFFVVNFWRDIKNPYPMLEAFSQLVEKGIDFELRIGGYGPILDEMQKFVSQKGLENHVVFLGKMYKEGIAEEMNNSDAYLFSSNYETFSAVCAQSLCCGCPIIGPKLDAIREYAGDEDMITVKENNLEQWELSLKKFILEKNRFDRERISKKLKKYLSHENIKMNYKQFLGELI